MIAVGNHYLLTVARDERGKVREFYISLLGCTLVSSDSTTQNVPENVDLFQFPGHEIIGVRYADNPGTVLSRDDHRLACWMELKTGDVEGLKQRLRDFGIEEIRDFWDKSHFYFHAPGGQVFRLLADTE